MEIGAVKQAYNNEVILLKKKLNQAKIQIIHKLTRKAKTLTQKKAPENIKEKLIRKAKAAVNEVLIIKKITNKELAKFAISHAGELKDFLNKPNVDNAKACARLLLHKTLQDKYQFFRSRFSGVPVEDLVMSREERRRLKQEEKEVKKKKRKEQNDNSKNKALSSVGKWSVEDLLENDSPASKKVVSNIKSDESDEVSENDDDSDDESQPEDYNTSNASVVEDDNNSNESVVDEDVHKVQDNSGNSSSEDSVKKTDDTFMEVESEEQKKSERVDSFEKVNTKTQLKNQKVSNKTKKPPKEDKRNKIPKKNKEASKKNNMVDLVQARKLKMVERKKTNIEKPVVVNKIVDPFFITATGENYMSLAEPRGPDEVKEVHKQGNRQMRRAAKFGHEMKFKPRRDGNFGPNQGFREKSNRFDRQGTTFDKSSSKFDRQNGFNNDRGFRNNGRQDDNNSGNNFRRNYNNNDKNRPTQKSAEKSGQTEKLHPSWEAKKKISSIVPFQGKKITFD